MTDAITNIAGIEIPSIGGGDFFVPERRKRKRRAV